MNLGTKIIEQNKHDSKTSLFILLFRIKATFVLLIYFVTNILFYTIKVEKWKKKLTLKKG